MTRPGIEPRFPGSLANTPYALGKPNETKPNLNFNKTEREKARWRLDMNAGCYLEQILEAAVNKKEYDKIYERVMLSTANLMDCYT